MKRLYRANTVALVVCLFFVGCDKPRSTGLVNSASPTVELTVDEFRKAATAPEWQRWFPKQTFYDKFGKPKRVATWSNNARLDYECKDGAATVKCLTSPDRVNQDKLWVIGVDQLR